MPRVGRKVEGCPCTPDGRVRTWPASDDLFDGAADPRPYPVLHASAQCGMIALADLLHAHGSPRSGAPSQVGGIDTGRQTRTGALLGLVVRV